MRFQLIMNFFGEKTRELLARKPERTAAQGCGIPEKYRRLDLRIRYAFRLKRLASRGNPKSR